MWRFLLIFPVTFVTCCFIFLLSTIFNNVFNLSFSTLFIYSLSFAIVAVPIIIILILHCKSKQLYAKLYYICGVICSFGLHMIGGCVVHYIIEYIFNSVYLVVDIVFIFIIPFIVTLHGFNNMKTIHIDKVKLHYNEYKGQIKIAHLTDLHLGANYQHAFVTSIVNKIRNEIHPDIVVITGDLADGSLRVQAEWLQPFNYLNVPVLYITGNHETIHGKDPLLTVIKENTKIHYIGNSVYEYKGVNFIGIDYENHLEKTLKKFTSGIGGVGGSTGPNVVLYHIPKMKPKTLNECGAFLMLAGHTHGGQVFPMQVFSYLGNRCYKGLYSFSNKINNSNSYVYVCEGVGAALLPMRTCSRSTIGEITIYGNYNGE